MNRNAFSYIRMSTKSQQNGDSRRRQLAKSKEYAKEHNLNFIETIEDIGISAYRGKNIKDGELGKFRKALQDKLIDTENTVLLVESLDRLSRDNAIDALGELNDFLKTGISIITVVDGQEFNQESVRGAAGAGLLYTAIGVMIRANEESKIKSERLSEAWEHKRSNIKNKPLTSICPSWLALNKKSKIYEKKENSADTVIKIFDLSINENMGATSIVKYLNGNIQTYPLISKPKNNKNVTGWYESYIKKILNNPAVHGEYQPHKILNGKRIPEGETVNNYFPPIISKERFTLAQAKMKERKVTGRGRKGNKFTNLFSQILTCASCGANVSIVNKGKPPKGGVYLICNNSKTNNNCNCPSWKYSDFENAFIRFIKEINLQNAFLEGNEKNKESTMRDSLIVLNEQLKAKKHECKTLRNNAKSASPRTFEALNIDIEESLIEVETIKNKVKSIKLDLAELENRNAKKSHEELLTLLEKSKMVLSNDELKSLRRKISAITKDVVSDIILYNKPKNISSDLDLNDIPKSLIEEMKGKTKNKYDSDEKIKALFDTEYGKRRYNETQRNFTVHFKSGVSKTVFPYLLFGFKVEQGSDIEDADVFYEDGCNLLDDYSGAKNTTNYTNTEIDEIIKDVEDDFKKNK